MTQYVDLDARGGWDGVDVARPHVAYRRATRRELKHVAGCMAAPAGVWAVTWFGTGSPALMVALTTATAVGSMAWDFVHAPGPRRATVTVVSVESVRVSAPARPALTAASP